MFMANYADVLTNAPLPDMIERFEASSAVASLLAVPPQSSHHVVDIGDDGLITQVTPMRDLRQWENGGYFLLRPEIFDHLNEGEDLVEDAIMRLVPQRARARLPLQGVLVTRGHREGTRAARGDVPPGDLPVDDLGPGAVGRDPAGRRRPARGRTASRLARHPRRRRGDPPRAAAASAGAPRAGRCPCSRLGAHPDDIEIGAGGTLLSLAGPCPGLQVRYVVLTGNGGSPAGGARGRAAPSCRRRISPSTCTTCPRAGCRRSGAQVKDVLEAGGAIMLARPHHRAVAGRRPPGSPDHRRDRAHRLPRPALPRLRDPEMGR